MTRYCGAFILLVSSLLSFSVAASEEEKIMSKDELEALESVKAMTAASKDNFRQQLSRARNKVIEFTSESCGFVNSHAKCSCEKKLTGALNRKRVAPDRIYFASDRQYSYDEVRESLATTQQNLKTLALQKSINHYKCPIDLAEMIESMVIDGVKANKALHQESCK